MFEALYYDRLEDEKVRCRLCPHECLIYPGRAGICFARYNEAGSLYSLTYGRVSNVALDPIEKKPLHYFHAGSMILSVGAIGCTLVCSFCQNWQIAHPKDVTAERPTRAVEVMTDPMTVGELVHAAVNQADSGNIGVAFTYNEPFVSFEYVLEAAKELRNRGQKVVLVTNGYVSEAPLLELLPYIDAMNIDIKAFSDTFYKKIGGRLDVVMRTAELAKDSCHVELTNLLIPGLNTSVVEISALVDWVAESLGSDTPLHFSRYFPARRSTIQATGVEVLEAAQRIASKRLQNVVLGNI